MITEPNNSATYTSCNLLEGLTVAVGFSGHGFALAPAVGRCVADQINGHPTPELDGLSPSRMASFHPHAVETFIAEATRGDFLVYRA